MFNSKHSSRHASFTRTRWWFSFTTTMANQTNQILKCQFLPVYRTSKAHDCRIYSTSERRRHPNKIRTALHYMDVLHSTRRAAYSNQVIQVICFLGKMQLEKLVTLSGHLPCPSHPPPSRLSTGSVPSECVLIFQSWFSEVTSLLDYQYVIHATWFLPVFSQFS